LESLASLEDIVWTFLARGRVDEGI